MRANSDRDARAERGLISALLQHPRLIGDVVGTLTVDDFAHDAYRRLYEVITTVWDARRPVTLVAVGEELMRRGWVADVGGWAAVAELPEEYASAHDATACAALVRDHATLRRLAAAGHQLVGLAEAADATAGEAVAAAEARVYAVARGREVRAVQSAGAVLQEVVDDLDRRSALPAAERLAAGVPSGLAALDELSGGWQRGELVILAARPAVGKTAMAGQLARHAAEQGRAVLFVSLEMSAAELGARWLAALADVDGRSIRRADLTPAECGRAVRAVRRADGWRLYVDDTPRASVTQIAAVARRLSARGDLDLVLVDYLQLVDPDDRRLPRHEQVASVSRRLKGLARELAVPLVALAQLNRGVEDRGQQARPRLSDLRESGGIEADADVVVLLHRPPANAHLLELLVAKNRNGPTGEVMCEFDRARMTFAPAGVPGGTPFGPHPTEGAWDATP